MVSLPLVSPRTRNEPWMVAPAEVPPMTPPRASRAFSSVSVRVSRYASARRHWRPPAIQTPLASRSGATKESESATVRSRVCSNVSDASLYFFHGSSDFSASAPSIIR